MSGTWQTSQLFGTESVKKLRAAPLRSWLASLQRGQLLHHLEHPPRPMKNCTFDIPEHRRPQAVPLKTHSKPVGTSKTRIRSAAGAPSNKLAAWQNICGSGLDLLTCHEHMFRSFRSASESSSPAVQLSTESTPVSPGPLLQHDASNRKGLDAEMSSGQSADDGRMLPLPSALRSCKTVRLERRDVWRDSGACEGVAGDAQLQVAGLLLQREPPAWRPTFCNAAIAQSH